MIHCYPKLSGTNHQKIKGKHKYKVTQMKRERKRGEWALVFIVYILSLSNLSSLSLKKIVKLITFIGNKKPSFSFEI